MKKFLTFLMVATMLVSMFALTVSAEQTNMDVNIPRFAKQPTIDGCVTTEEWGDVTVKMVTEGAATVDDEEVGYNEALGLRNTFYYFAVEGICDTLAYDMWIRWDDNFLYVAAIVEDPDPFSLPKGGAEIWNGDCIQIRVDEKGPSAIMLGADPNFNYKTDAYSGNRFKKPWSNDKEVFNAIMGMVKGDTPTFWRCGKNYDDGWNLVKDGALVGVNLVQKDDGTCTITYEGAIPWAAVNATLIPKAGDVYGMGVAVACSDSNEINGCLQWGSGIMFADEQPRGTRGGSQAIILTADEVTPADGYEVATEAPEETTEETDAPVVTTKKPAGENDGSDATTKPTTKPTVTGTGFGSGDEGSSAWIWIVVGVAAAVVVAVVVIVIVKKKKN
ncbi:MAG: hypothetical protein E7578_05430 [Ruminococcaceae bacterium]|nr:hypothetical protein [Oscillospiraceae bacterium]